jgi:hypothetical protein
VRMDAGEGDAPPRVDMQLDRRSVVPGIGRRYRVQERWFDKLAEAAQRFAQDLLFLGELRRVVELLPLAPAAAGAEERAIRFDAAGAGLLYTVQEAAQDAARRAADGDVRDIARGATGDEHDAPVLQRVDGVPAQGHAAARTAFPDAARRALVAFAQIDY